MKKYGLREDIQIEYFGEYIEEKEFEILELEDILKINKESLTDSYKLLLDFKDFVGLIPLTKGRYAYAPIYQDEIICIQSEVEKVEFMKTLYNDYINKNKGTNRMNIFKEEL